MNTLKDLVQMKTRPMDDFDTEFNFLIARLQNYFLSKSDGLNRIKNELKNWEEDAQTEIIRTLIGSLKRSGLCLDELDDLRFLLPYEAKIKLYFDESGQSGNIMPNKNGDLYRKHQAQFVLGGIITKSDFDEKQLLHKCEQFKERWNISYEHKSTDLIKHEQMLLDFIDNVLDDEHFFVCCYDKKYYLATAIAHYLLGFDFVKSKPLHFYKLASALVREDESFLFEYCKVTGDPSSENIKAFLQYVVDFPYKKIDNRLNLFRSVTQQKLDVQDENGLQKPPLSIGNYNKITNTNVISMNALGESLLSVCYMENTSVDKLEVYHDKIEQYEEEFETISLHSKTVKINFVDSKENELIQLADYIAGVFRRCFSEMVEIFSNNQQWNPDKQYFLKLISKVISRLDMYNIKFVVPISDWALALTVARMFSEQFPLEKRNKKHFNQEFMNIRIAVEENIAFTDMSF